MVRGILNLANRSRAKARISDCDTVFIQCNFQENHNAPESKLATEHSMIKHEFLEAILRLSVNKYVKS